MGMPPCLLSLCTPWGAGLLPSLRTLRRAWHMMLHWPSDLDSKTRHPARDTQVCKGVEKSLGSCQSECPPLRRETARGLAAGQSRADLQTLLSSTSHPTRPSACVSAALRLRHSTLETKWTAGHPQTEGCPGSTPASARSGSSAFLYILLVGEATWPNTWNRGLHP